MKEIIMATNNAHKLEEVRQILGEVPNTKYLLTEVSNLSGSYVQTVTAEEWPTTTIVGARSAAWEGHGHARITLLLE